MAYIDKELRFSDEQVVGNAGDEISDDVVDLGAANLPHTNSDQTVGENTMKLVVVIDEAFDALTSMDITLRSADNAALTTNPVDHCTRNLLLADINAIGDGFYVIGTFSGPVNKRYLGVHYNINGANPTVGKMTAFLTRDVQANPPD